MTEPTLQRQIEEGEPSGAEETDSEMEVKPDFPEEEPDTDREIKPEGDIREPEIIQRQSSSNRPVQEIPSGVGRVISSAGQPLPASVLAFMEPRFGRSFRGIRVHTDAEAAAAADELDAHAFTVGHNIAFAHGRYAPDSPSGRHLLAHELTHVAQQSAAGARIQRACKNQKAIDERLKRNPRKYPATVTMYPKEIAQGDTLDQFAKDTKKDNTVHVVGHYLVEIRSLNKKINTGRIGNCALVLKGWKDPAIGALSSAAPTGKLPGDVKRAIAVVYAEQTRTSSNAKLQQEYIWYSMRKRLDLGMHGPTLDKVINQGGYFGKGTPDYRAAIKDLTLSGKHPAPSMAGVVGAKAAVLNNWTASIPSDAGPYYFHWRARVGGPKSNTSHVETCFQSSAAATPLDKEKECAFDYAVNVSNFNTSVTNSQGWLKRIPGDTSPPDDRIGSMYIYSYG